LEGALQEAISLDVDREAAALRSGKKPTGKKAEPEAQKDLDQGRHTVTVYERALEKARSEEGEYRAKHREELARDVQNARLEIAREMAEHASKALAEYSRFADQFYLVKELGPAAPVSHGSFPTVMNVLTTKTQGPQRGEVEAMLQHLIGLGSVETAETTSTVSVEEIDAGTGAA